MVDKLLATRKEVIALCAFAPSRYHLGSIAFGSLLIAIVQIMRLILTYIERKLKSYDNPVIIFVVK